MDTRKIRKILWKNPRRHDSFELDSVELWQEFNEENDHLISQYITFSSLWEIIDTDISSAIEVAKTILDRIGKENQ